MKKDIFKRICLLSVFCIVMTAFAAHLPTKCYGETMTMWVEVSPNIINIDAQRWGEIRIFTDLSYANYDFDGDDRDSEVFVYVNELEDSVENIRPTRDSWGNLILKFNLEDLLNVPELMGSLIIDGDNTFTVVVIKSDDTGDTVWEGADSEVYVMDKKAAL
ncbi:MAG: hypothetical protein JSV56_08570 [Methanomassiliicoccales archaeon]|nr:MAG: hypothetical protein JSV56_08570 [Methanomassiliicoccales archaeon]